MPAFNTITLPDFWASIEAAWSAVPGSADARAGFISSDRAIRDKTVKDVDRLFGQAFKSLVDNLSKYGSQQLSEWAMHWDTVYMECSMYGGDFDDEIEEGCDSMLLCAFVVLVGEAAVDAFSARSQDYLHYKISAAHQNDVMCVPAVVQEAKMAQQSKMSS